MTAEDFFLTEDFTTNPATEQPTAETAEQGTLFDACTYRGPNNRKGVANVAMLDPFGQPAV